MALNLQLIITVFLVPLPMSLLTRHSGPNFKPEESLFALSATVPQAKGGGSRMLLQIKLLKVPMLFTMSMVTNVI